jgi:hypothetical protein
MHFIAPQIVAKIESVECLQKCPLSDTEMSVSGQLEKPQKKRFHHRGTEDTEKDREKNFISTTKKPPRS